MLNFKIEPDGNEFRAWISELLSCHTYNRTIAEAMQNLKDAVQLYLEVKMEEEIAKQTLELA